ASVAPRLQAAAKPIFRGGENSLTPGNLRTSAAVLSAEALSTTMISTPPFGSEERQSAICAAEFQVTMMTEIMGAAPELPGSADCRNLHQRELASLKQSTSANTNQAPCDAYQTDLRISPPPQPP